MNKPLRVMMTCDDGGLSPGIDEAVIQLYEEGIASTVSVMSNMPHARAGLALYRDYPGLEVGAHLNLTERQALTPAMQSSSLVKNGTFRGRVQCFLQGLFLTNALQTIVFDELDAQMQVFLSENINPVHITTHHHFHILPGLKQTVYELARKYRVKWIRNSRLASAIIPFNPLAQVSPGKQPDDQEFIEPDYVVLIQEWLKKSPAQLLSELKRLNGIIEVVIHPCTMVDTLFPQGIMYKPEERHRELLFIREFYAISRGTIEVITIR